VNAEPSLQGSELEVDVVVIGGGMAGMSAAGYAASRGAIVCVIEKGGEIGGSAALSSGALSAAASYEKLRERAPQGNARLQASFVDRFAAAAGWLRSLGVISGEFSSEFLKGYRLDILAYMQRCEALVVSQGGWVLRSTRVDRLVIDDGAVRGVIARDASGLTVVIRGRGSVLATGGFQGDPSMLHEQFGANAQQLLLRANPHSTGDGLRLGLQAGADLAGDLSSFYGHLIAWPLIEFGPREYQRMSLSRWIPQGILINLSGERFADESIGWQWCATMTAKQPRARAAIVVDAAGHARGRAATEQRRGGGGDFGTLDEIRGAGARVESRETIAELASVLAGWGYDTSRLPVTIARYNDVIDGGAPDSPPRRWERHRFGPGPFTAFDTRPAITGTQGGLRTDESARVIDRGGRPIPGLFVAGTDAGDFYNGGYAGNLSVACVFGMSAVESILGAKLFPSDPALVG
jgi:succinate dehydrogenase/fumarate reductase flavoprotein subunit